MAVRRILVSIVVAVALIIVLPVSGFTTTPSLCAIRPSIPFLSTYPRTDIAKDAASLTGRLMTLRDSDERSIDSPLDRPVLAALDFLAILVFAFVETASHATTSDLLAVAAVAAPFWISWFTITPFLGLYSENATADKVGALLTTAKGWIVAIPVGCVLRGVLKGYVPPVPFIIVTMIATLVMLGVVRVAYSTVTKN